MPKEKLEFVQDFIPLKELKNGIVETTDGRFLKILEIEPINFLLRSDEEQWGIISTFASWLKISPMRLQFKSVTRKADSDQYVAGLQTDLEQETVEEAEEDDCELVAVIAAAIAAGEGAVTTDGFVVRSIRRR